MSAEHAALPTPPDGGWGWAVVFGSFLIHVVADGVAYTIGVYIPVLTEYFPGVTKSELGWIGSIMVGVTMCSGPVASALTNRFGCRVITIAGSFISALGFFISYFATNVYFLYFSLGIVAGIGLGLIYLPAIVILSYYFEKKRAFATGLAVCGSGVGTFVFAPLAHWLVENYGWHGALLIESGILLNCCISGAVFRPIHVPKAKKRPLAELAEMSSPDEPIKPLSAIRPDIRRSLEGISSKSEVGKKMSGSHDALTMIKASGDKEHNKEEVLGPMSRKDAFYTGSLHNIPLYNEDPVHFTESMVSLHHVQTSKSKASVASSSMKMSCLREVTSVFDPVILKDILFQMFAWSNFLTNFTFFIPFAFIADRAFVNGYSQEKSAILLSIIGIFNTIGRILFGWVGDRPCINRLMMYNSVLVACGLATCVSVLGNSYAYLALYSATYGLLIGVYVTLTPIILVDLLGLDKLSNAFGIVLLFQGVATMLGPPLAGYTFDQTDSYTVAFILFGTLTAISGAMLYPIPCIKRMRDKNHPVPEEDVQLGRQLSRSASISSKDKPIKLDGHN